MSTKMSLLKKWEQMIQAQNVFEVEMQGILDKIYFVDIDEVENIRRLLNECAEIREENKRVRMKYIEVSKALLIALGKWQQ